MANKLIEKSLSVAIKASKSQHVIMLELPEESYLDANIASIKLLTANGYEGVYLSFHRPFKNISYLLSQEKININKLLFIDIATALAQEEQEKNPRCVHVSAAIEVDEIVRAVYTLQAKLKSRKKFIFIDSITTIALYKPLSETLRFADFLIRTVRKESNCLLILNVAKDLAQKRFIKDIALHVDKSIEIKQND